MLCKFLDALMANCGAKKKNNGELNSVVHIWVRWATIRKYTHIEENETSDQSDNDGGYDDRGENINVHQSIIIVCRRTDEIVEEIFVSR